jgi:hypothetical protein
VIPAIESEAELLFVTAHDAPAKLIVTVEPEVDAVAVQLVNPLPSVTVGVAGIVKAELNTTVILSTDDRAPEALVVNPTAQLAVDPAVCGVPTKETLETLVAATIITSEVAFLVES